MECIRVDGGEKVFCALTEAVVLMGKQQAKISQRVSTNAFCQQYNLD